MDLDFFPSSLHFIIVHGLCARLPLYVLNICSPAGASRSRVGVILKFGGVRCAMEPPKTPLCDQSRLVVSRGSFLVCPSVRSQPGRAAVAQSSRRPSGGRWAPLATGGVCGPETPGGWILLTPSVFKTAINTIADASCCWVSLFMVVCFFFISLWCFRSSLLLHPSPACIVGAEASLGVCVRLVFLLVRPNQT